MGRRISVIKACRVALLAGMLLVIHVILPAQSGKIPPFSMVRADGKIFRAQDLPTGKPIMILYFSPECDHCDKLMQELLQRQADFKKASIAMITYLPVDRVKSFVQKYNLDKQPNMYVGTEGSTFFVRNYYKIQEMPFIALYTKNGNLVQSYNKEHALPDVSRRLKAL